MWNRPVDFTPIPHFAKCDPNNLWAARAKLAELRTGDVLILRLPTNALRRFGAAAAKRGIKRDALIRLLLLEVASAEKINDILED